MRKLRSPEEVKRGLTTGVLVLRFRQFFSSTSHLDNNTNKIFSLALLVKAGISSLQSKFIFLPPAFILSNDYYHTNLSIP